MLKKMQKSVCALAVLACTTSAVMAESVEVKVIGTINPVACTPTLGGGGTVDYGTIKNSTLSADAYTVLSAKTVNVSVVCDAPVKVAFRSFSNRPNTTASSVGEWENGFTLSPVDLSSVNVLALSTTQNNVGGLGLDGTTKIGGYGMLLNGITLDGVAARNTYSGNGGSGWAAGVPWNGALTQRNPIIHSFTTSTLSEAVPTAFTTMNGTITVQAYINKASELDLTKPVVLDGSSTIELVYL